MSASTPVSYHIEHNEPHGQWEAHLDEDIEDFEEGFIIGYVSYDLDESNIYLTHTVVRHEFEGHGIASALVKTACSEVKAAGEYKIVPICPFAVAYLKKHPEYKA